MDESGELMAYGDYDGPNKPNKGHEGGACNRTRCQCEPANWWNHGSYSWYCDDCREQIEFDLLNSVAWQRNFFPRLGHPMFETREMMNSRDSTSPRHVEQPRKCCAAARRD
jgi:hypothetical protein